MSKWPGPPRLKIDQNKQSRIDWLLDFNGSTLLLSKKTNLGPIFFIFKSQCSAKGLNWKKIALKQKIHGIGRMDVANTGSALKYSNLVEVLKFLEKY